MGIEPTRPAWKAGILAIELHPHIGNEKYNITNNINSQELFLKNLICVKNRTVFSLWDLTNGKYCVY